jgi:hypothetical protein
VVGNRTIFWQAMVLIMLIAVGSQASAAITASVDRPNVDLNESFTLEVEIDDATDLEPDFSVLEDDFFVGQVSKLSNTSIYNGEIRRSLTWTVALMPKNVGTQEIPPIPLGNDQSNSVTITVNEPSNAPPGEADVFVTSEVDVDESYVQAQILYRIRIYRAVATRQPSLREPSISGVETLLELAGDERQYESVLNGRAYNVIERVIALFPQESGEIRISPARFEARVLRDGRITGRKVFQSDSHTVNVLPIPAPPAEHPDAAWLPARDVQITESWSRPPDEMEAGEPVTRIIRLEALGQLETQLPTLEAPEVDGVNAYSDQPELGREIGSGGIRGVREDQYAIIGLAGGEIELPAIEVPWWDLDAGEWKVASLPARTLSIKGAAMPPQPVELPVTEPEPAVTEKPPAGPTEEETVAVVTFWQRAAELLGVLWLLTLAAWWWSTRARPRKKRAPREPQATPAHQQQAHILKQARKAAVQSDATEVRHLLLEWSKLQWPDDAPRSIGEFANRVEEPLADELRRLSAVSYGQGERAWEGSGLAKALQSVSLRADDATSGRRDPLPPLMPPAV